MTENTARLSTALADRYRIERHLIGRTGYYERGDDGVIVNGPYVDNSYKWAGGGFLSTPEDLLRIGCEREPVTSLASPWV